MVASRSKRMGADDASGMARGGVMPVRHRWFSLRGPFNVGLAKLGVKPIYALSPP